MNKYYKNFIFFVIVIVSIVSAKLYLEYKEGNTLSKLSIKSEAKAIADFLVAFRTTYQDVYIKNGIILDKTNIHCLPVSTTNQISKIFSSLNIQSKIATVSNRPRNSKNQANKRQLEVINYFNHHKNTKYIFKQIEDKYYYSKPLYITKTCLKCHGAKKDAPKIIQENYDQAYDYKIGDLRGIIDIELSQTALSARLEQDNIHRILTAILIVLFILLIVFFYMKFNKQQEQHIKELYDDLSIKNKELEESEHEIILINEGLQKQKDDLEILYQQSSDGILIIKDGKFIDCNDSALKMLGYKQKDDLIDIDPSQISPEYQSDGILSYIKAQIMIEKAMKKGTNTFEWIHKKSNGKEFWAEVVLTKMIQGKDFIIHAVIRDITKRKKNEYELEQLTHNLELKVQQEMEKNKLKDQQMLHQSRLAQMGEMISMIAHQWRQPLAAISSTSSALNIQAQLDQINKDDILLLTDKISNFSQHLSYTIDDFRNFFKTNKTKTKTTCNELIDKVLSIIETSLINKNIQLDIEHKCNKPILTFENEVKQVILNLIKNAEDILIEKEIENPKIKIVALDGCITISDNGGGVPSNIIDKIFDPYFSTKTKKDGTGLGLYMSKTIIEDHCKGKLTVQNTTNGAMFIVQLTDLSQEQRDD